MSSIISTGLAPVATKDSELYLYFQDNNNTILEAYSKDGKNWSVSSAIVAKDARGDGAPLTAYYVENGADKARKSTVCFQRQLYTYNTNTFRSTSSTSTNKAACPRL